MKNKGFFFNAAFLIIDKKRRWKILTEMESKKNTLIFHKPGVFQPLLFMDFCDTLNIQLLTYFLWNALCHNVQCCKFNWILPNPRCCVKSAPHNNPWSTRKSMTLNGMHCQLIYFPLIQNREVKIFNWFVKLTCRIKFLHCETIQMRDNKANAFDFWPFEMISRTSFLLCRWCYEET